MNFYFIHPLSPISFAGYQFGSRMALRRTTNPPLGLLTVAAMIPAPHRVTLCDENARSINWAQECDWVGLTGMHNQKQRIREIAARFRELGKRVIIGGPSVMATPQDYRDVADVLFIGEAEELWTQCLRDLENDTPVPEYRPTGAPALNTSPPPRYELVSRWDYLALSVQTTRGCPYRCEFCDIITLYGRRPRTKPIDHVMTELKSIVAMGATSIALVDDNFIGNPKYASELLQEIAVYNRTLKKPFYFSCQVSINLADKPELIELLREAGCRSAFIGIETPRKASLEETLKTQNLRTDLLTAVETIQSQGIQVYPGMIVGFDSDDAAIFEEQMDFINEAHIPNPLYNKLGALPGTPLHERLRREGRLIVEETYGGLGSAMNFRPANMTTEELERGFRWMLSELYSAEAYSKRSLEELERLVRDERLDTDHSFLFLAGALFWVLLWYVFDPHRKELLRFFRITVPTVLRRYPQAIDVLLQRCVQFRHIKHYVNAVLTGNVVTS